MKVWRLLWLVFSFGAVILLWIPIYYGRLLHYKYLAVGVSANDKTGREGQFATADSGKNMALEIPTRNSTRMRGVIIATNYRSGSSFFGELFNQHPDVYYAYEPLILIERTKERTTQLLQSILNCGIRNVDEFLDRDPGDHYSLKTCLKDNVCFRSRIKNFCSARYCYRPHYCSLCKKLSTNDMNAVCKSKQLTVIKVIRLNALNTLRPLIDEANTDVRILHLVRDPRGISSSRVKLKRSGEMKSTCDKMFNNVKTALVDPPAWLQGRYKLVRYEDVAINPVEMAEDIYRFVGLDMKESIRRWIAISTKGVVQFSTDPKALKFREIRRKRRRKIPLEKFERMILSNAYTTIRHSNATWQDWRHHLADFEVQQIQKLCSEIMDLLGYKQLPENAESSDNYDVIGPLSAFNGTTIQL